MMLVTDLTKSGNFPRYYGNQVEDNGMYMARNTHDTEKEQITCDHQSKMKVVRMDNHRQNPLDDKNASALQHAYKSVESF